MGILRQCTNNVNMTVHEFPSQARRAPRGEVTTGRSGVLEEFYSISIRKIGEDKR